MSELQVFQFVYQVVVRAIGGGKQCEGRHRRMKVAKALAADKLLQELQKVPMHRKIQVSPPLFSMLLPL